MTPDELDELLVSVFDQTHIAYSVLDIDGRQIASNQAFAELIGLPAAQALGEAVADITRETDRPWTMEFVRRVMSGELHEFRTEKVYRRADGSEINCHLIARPIRNAAGEIVALLGAIEPVLERPVVSDTRMRRMIENINDTVSLMAADGTLLDTSGRYRPVLGYPKEFWASRTIFDVLHPDDLPLVLELREDVLTEPGREGTGDYRVRNSDGDYETIEVHAVNLVDDPDVGGIVVTTRNTTKSNRMLAEVAASRDQALQQADLRTRLIATVSHELRNPLHAMSGLSELLATSELPPALTDLAETLHRQVIGLTRVIDDLLETSRLEIGVIELRSEIVDPRKLVEDVVMLGKSQAAGRAVEVSGSVAASVPTAIESDAGRLRQVLTNLVGNAVKFTDAGHVRLHLRTEGSVLVCEVADTGRGIPRRELSKVFEPFSTGSTGGSRSGAGLGLSIVKQIALTMGGTTSVSSMIAQGSTFTVRIPLVAAVTEEDEVTAADCDTVQVLVVEDNPVNQMLAKNQLERLGMVPVIVGSGEEAIELLSRGEGPFTILMDHQLPGMDGLECTRQIREMETDGRRRSVIIGVTASAMAGDRDACLIGGMDDFLAKPVSLQDLGDTLQRWTSEAANQAAGREAAAATTDVGESATNGGTLVTQTTVLDEATLDQLAGELGGREVVAMLAATYIEELPTRLDALRASAAADDISGISRTAHTLKSSSRLLGGLVLGDLCEQAEHATEVPVAKDCVERVIETAERFGAELESWTSV